MADRPPDCDLHPYFRDPDKARAILDICIADCLAKGKSPIRVVHGKGRGDFKKLIYSHLAKHPDVDGFVECDPLHGGGGATWVHLAGVTGKESAHERVDGQLRARSRPIGPYWRLLIYAIVLFASFAIISDWVIRIVILIFLFWLEYKIARGSSRTDL